MEMPYESPRGSEATAPGSARYFAGSVLVALVVVAFALRTSTLPRERALMLGIFVLAALLWATEAIPLFATSMVVLALQIVLIANPGHCPGLGFAVGKSPTAQSILSAAIDPVLFLFFGGFLLARAAVKEGADAAMASTILRPFGTRPRFVMLGVMLVTALFSMWMSNTAATAMMITLVVPMIATLPPGHALRKAMILAVPFAANIGGIGTPIGTPPNAIAIGFLRQSGHSISFAQWMLIAVPLMLTLLGLAWLLLLLFFPARTKEVRMISQRRPLSARGVYVVCVFITTVLLWVTDGWHGLGAPVVALLAGIALTAPRLLTYEDVNTLDWNILILIAGGISLGAGMQMTGLDQTLVEMLSRRKADSAFPLIVVFAGITLLLGTFMSNTAAANLLLPVAISLGARFDRPGISPVLQLAVTIALTASLSMALPISTPPNAIAFSRRELTTRQMAIPGAILSIGGTILIIFLVTKGPAIYGIGQP